MAAGSSADTTDADDGPDSARAGTSAGGSLTGAGKPPTWAGPVPQRRTLRRSVGLVRAFQFEQQDPDRFYDLISADAIGLLASHVDLRGKSVIDVGGGAGYLGAAARAAGARCAVFDSDIGELTWRGTPPPVSVLADGRRLPLADGAVDVALSGNVLEHTRDPYELCEELVRVVRPGGGVVWISFTNWLSPHGGHETSPWHYVGGDYARRRYLARRGAEPKNRFGENMFRIDVGPTLAWARSLRGVDVVDIGPRYHPGWARAVCRIPGLREVATWNLELTLVRR
jgi:SAM-dependent methyltransferase